MGLEESILLALLTGLIGIFTGYFLFRLQKDENQKRKDEEGKESLREYLSGGNAVTREQEINTLLRERKLRQLYNENRTLINIIITILSIGIIGYITKIGIGLVGAG